MVHTKKKLHTVEYINQSSVCLDFWKLIISFLCLFFHFRFYVDNVPIREFKRTESMGGDFPSKPMTLYATIWDGSDWATNGGKYRVNYKYAPYIAEFSDLVLHGCAFDPIEHMARCDNAEGSEGIPTGVTRVQRIKMEGIRKKHMTYSYCYDHIRYKVPPSECVINPQEAERLRTFDPVTFGNGRRHHSKRHHHSRISQAKVTSSIWEGCCNIYFVMRTLLSSWFPFCLI